MRGARRADRLAMAICVGCGFLLLAMGGLGMAARSHHAMTTVREDGSMATPPGGTMLWIIDKTDPMTDHERDGLTTLMRTAARDELRAGERLSVWTIGDHEDGTLSKEFCRCNPGLRAGGWTDNVGRVRARFDSTFGGPLDHVLADVSRRETAPRSPIMEATREVSELREFTEGTGPRRLRIVSDMLQNSALWSQYRSTGDFAAFSRRPVWRDLRASLRGVSVEIVYLHRQRDAGLQGAAHREFWRQYFRACDAASVTFSRL
jgi:hypothetical protein